MLVARRIPPLLSSSSSSSSAASAAVAHSLHPHSRVLSPRSLTMTGRSIVDVLMKGARLATQAKSERAASAAAARKDPPQEEEEKEKEKESSSSSPVVKKEQQPSSSPNKRKKKTTAAATTAVASTEKKKTNSAAAAAAAAADTTVASTDKTKTTAAAAAVTTTAASTEKKKKNKEIPTVVAPSQPKHKQKLLSFRNDMEEEKEEEEAVANMKTQHEDPKQKLKEKEKEKEKLLSVDQKEAVTLPKEAKKKMAEKEQPKLKPHSVDKKTTMAVENDTPLTLQQKQKQKQKQLSFGNGKPKEEEEEEIPPEEAESPKKKKMKKDSTPLQQKKQENSVIDDAKQVQVAMDEVGLQDKPKKKKKIEKESASVPQKQKQNSVDDAKAEVGLQEETTKKRTMEKTQNSIDDDAMAEEAGLQEDIKKKRIKKDRPPSPRKQEQKPQLKSKLASIDTPKQEEKKEEVAKDTSSPQEGSPKKKKTKIDSIPQQKNQKQKSKQVSLAQAMQELRKKHQEFDPNTAVFWKDGDHVPFLFLARAFDMISNESGRLVIIDLLCNVFRTVITAKREDLLAVVYLSANKVSPAHEGIELGIGDTAIIKALAEAFGRSEDQIKSQMKTLGDLGLVAKASRSTQKLMFKPPPLTCVKVLEAFRVIAKEAGKDSQDRKRARIKSLLVAATDCEPQYLVRLLQSKMRIGLAEQTVLASLAQAAVLSEVPVPASETSARIDEAVQIMKHTYSVLPIYDKIVPALLDVGVRKIQETCCFTLGVPVGPMLAKPTKGVSEILDKFQDTEFTCEYKYDGERAQIHYLEDGTIEIYSRNAERSSGKFPDIIASISRFKKPEVTSFVLDSEVVAYDREKNHILPFQVLSTRARKGVIVSDIKVQVCLYAFDLLYLNGQELLQDQLITRREKLHNSFVEVHGEFNFATTITSNDLEEIQAFLKNAVNDSCEGLIVKTLAKDATYEPAKRSNNWLKLKKDYMDSVGDSLDLVPIGAFHGRGKRVGVYGAFLLACYDDQNDEYQSICKIGTGFTDAVLEERSESLRKHVIPKPKPYYRYGETLDVDVWFESTEVWEVKAADLSISPVHKAAIGAVDSEKGISLRFPRLLRVRSDKSPEQATTAEQVADMYLAQKINHAKEKDEDED